MNIVLRAAKNVLKMVLSVDRGTSGHLILDAGQEQDVKDALALVQSEASASEGFTPGHPPASIATAWLLVRHEDADGEVDQVVLGVLYGEEWCEAGDWKAESTLDSIHADGGWMVGWMPYCIPVPVLANTPVTS